MYYFTFSSLYSTIFQGRYWADFAVKAQQLRVSSKHGAHQLSTCIFQLPFLWGISFISLKISLGWILTQTLYVMPVGCKYPSMGCRRHCSSDASPLHTRVRYMRINLDLDVDVSFWQPDFDFNDVEIYMGYSMRAMIPGLVIVAVAAALPVMLSFRRLPMNSVIVGTDSAAIASYCPPNTPPDSQNDELEYGQDPGIRLDNLMRSRRDIGRLKWGVLDLGSERDQRPGVLGLGSEDEVINVSPVAGNRYIPVALAFSGVKHAYQGQVDRRRG